MADYIFKVLGDDEFIAALEVQNVNESDDVDLVLFDDELEVEVYELVIADFTVT